MHFKQAFLKLFLSGSHHLSLIIHIKVNLYWQKIKQLMAGERRKNWASEWRPFNWVMVHPGNSSTVLAVKKWSCWPCPMRSVFSAGSKHVERSSTASYLLSTAVWLINSISYGALLKRFRASVIHIMVVFYHWKTAEAHFQRKWELVPDPICELLGSSVALIIFPLEYTNTKCTFWWSKPRYGNETFWILFLV